MNKRGGRKSLLRRCIITNAYISRKYRTRIMDQFVQNNRDNGGRREIRFRKMERIFRKSVKIEMNKFMQYVMLDMMTTKQDIIHYAIEVQSNRIRIKE